MLIASIIAVLLATAAAVVLFDRARTEAAGLRLLIEMSGLLQVSTSFTEAVEVVPVFGRHLFPALDGALYIASGSRFVLGASWGDTHNHASTHDASCSAVHRAQGRLFAAEELAERCGVADGATICLPLLAGRETIGVLTLRGRDGASLRTRTSLFASAFADHIALALTNLRLQETLRTNAQRDSLTGLFNRRYLEEMLTHELQRGREGKSKTGVIVVDVDHFKSFNDTYGHGGGDALLTQVARVMQSAFDDDAFICRYGGDEFVIVLPDTTPDEMRRRGEALSAAVRDLRINADGRMLGNVTISTGLAFAPDHANTVQGLIAAADRALYSAKIAGRDRVASPPPQALGRDAA
ncbi:MAG TPA: GGDEF domain-containing protein [Thermoanaerobaculia bacterium]|jgi:diguanylate cyclase (GGDEF)-like protein